MGGTALDVQTNRLSDAEFNVAKARVAEHVQSEFPDAVFHFVQPYRAKTSHGDMDVLFRQDTVPRTKLRESFEPEEMFNNGRVTSLDYDAEGDTATFQLDLVFMRPEWWDMAKAFHDWNALGNLMGKVARFRRFKYGFQGLRLPFYRDMKKSQKLGEFVVSRDPEAVFEFLGYDWERFQQGFDTLEDVFEFAMSSEWAAKNVFQKEQLTARQRQRDRKRSNYLEFEEWLEREFDPLEPNVAPKPPRYKEFVPRPSHRQALDDAAKAFPEANLKEKVDEAERELERRDAAHEVFSGRHVMEELGVEGKELGQLLGEMKQGFESDRAWQEYVLDRGRQRMLEEAAAKLNE